MYMSKSNKHYPFSYNKMDICTMPKPLERCFMYHYHIIQTASSQGMTERKNEKKVLPKTSPTISN